jgi:hypothetical protein
MMMSRELEMKCPWHSITTDCPLSHGLFVSLSHCPLPESPIVLLFIVPSSTAPPSHVVPLFIVPLTIVRLSTVQVSQFPHCHLTIAPWSHCSLSHCPLSCCPTVQCPLSRCLIVPCRQCPMVALACGAGDCRFESSGVIFVVQSFVSWHECRLGEI